MRGQLLINIGFNLDYLIINILSSCQHYRRVNFQRYGSGAADNQDHAYNLYAPASLL